MSDLRSLRYEKEKSGYAREIMIQETWQPWRTLRPDKCLHIIHILNKSRAR